MSVIYSTALKTVRMTATRDEMANGSLEILTSGDVLLVTLGLSASGGAISGATWTLEFDAGPFTGVAAGTAAKARIKDSGGTAEITGLTVGTSGSDINLISTTIAVGQEVELTSATITHA